ncbi:MAG: VWA domain-containing protein [Acidaminococcaceae bacterium]|nr:VWA domain-containing protein [Acidaminococcaceae bacterium]
MKKGLTEMVFILDRSGSMSGLEKETIGGFNSLIEKQKKAEGSAIVSTVLFDGEIDVIHDRIALEKISELTEKEYYARGCTALLDAVGRSVRHIRKVQKNLPEEEKPEHTIVVITTDGYENASHEYSLEKVKRLISRQQEKHKWEFLFLGANIDAVAAAGRIGIAANRAVRYKSDSIGTAKHYKVVSEAMCSMRCSAKHSIPDNWKAEIEEDVARRGV